MTRAAFGEMTSCVSWRLLMASVQPTKPKRVMRPVRVQGDHVCACYRCDNVVADAGGVTYMPCYPPLLHQPDLHDGGVSEGRDEGDAKRYDY